MEKYKNVFLQVKRPDDAGFEYTLGTSEMVFCFFSTVSYHLEGLGNWGKRFPRLLIDLCDHGIVNTENLDELSEELEIIFCELQQFHLSQAIYDIGDLSKPIPWEVIPGEENNNLAQPWVTPRGGLSWKKTFAHQIETAKRRNSYLRLVTAEESIRREPEAFLPKEKGRAF